MIVCTTGALGLKEAIDRLYVIGYAGFNLVHTAGFYTQESNVSLKSKSRIDKSIDLAARKFFEALQAKQLPSPRLIAPIAFRAQQVTFATAHECNLAECDYNYFRERGWSERGRKYYTDAKINPQECDWNVDRQNSKTNNIERTPGSSVEFMKIIPGIGLQGIDPNSALGRKLEM